MGNYNNFSLFYDIFTCDVEYKARTEYIMKIFEKWDKKPTLLLDFACGTGNFSVQFSKKGIDVIGVDCSEGMLATADGAVSCLDSLNHITDKEELKKTIEKISLFLEPGCLFVFDMNTPYKHKEVLSGSTYRMKKRGVECIWTNTLLEDGITIEIRLDFTYKTGLFKKETVSEIVREKAYNNEEITEMLTAAGLKLEAVYGENTFDTPKENSQRNVYVARKVN